VLRHRARPCGAQAPRVEKGDSGRYLCGNKGRRPSGQKRSFGLNRVRRPRSLETGRRERPRASSAQTRTARPGRDFAHAPRAVAPSSRGPEPRRGRALSGRAWT
jgi:hypothetical protein